MREFPSRNTCFFILAALCVTGLRVGAVAGWNFITLLAGLVARMCRMAATGWLFATDAIMHFMLKEFRGTDRCREEQSSLQRSRKMGMSMSRGWRR